MYSLVERLRFAKVLNETVVFLSLLIIILEGKNNTKKKKKNRYRTMPILNYGVLPTNPSKQ